MDHCTCVLRVAQANSLLARMCDGVDVVRKEGGAAVVVTAPGGGTTAALAEGGAQVLAGARS